MRRGFWKSACFSVVLAIIAGGDLRAEGVDVFGYFQAMAQYARNLDTTYTHPNSSLMLQEADLFLQKDISPSVSCLVDLQLTNNYSQAKSWGLFNLDEAWVKFSPTKSFNIKIGKIVPVFNTFNQIKNKFPLIPYLFRPLAYEASAAGLLDLQAWVPNHAFAQAYGSVPLSTIKLEYAVFAGNSEFTVGAIDPNNTGYTPSGFDTTIYKAGGGRIGIKVFGVTCGISGTYDYARNDGVNNTIGLFNKQIPAINTMVPPSMAFSFIPTLGANPRTRFGCDFNFCRYGITADFEYINTQYNFSSAEKAKLSQIVSTTTAIRGLQKAGPVFSDDFTKTFFNANIMYDFLDKYFVAIGYASLCDKSDLVLTGKGLNQAHAEIGYHLNDNVTLKTQVVNLYNDVPDKGVKYNKLSIFNGVSVYF